MSILTSGYCTLVYDNSSMIIILPVWEGLSDVEVMELVDVVTRLEEVEGSPGLYCEGPEDVLDDTKGKVESEFGGSETVIEVSIVWEGEGVNVEVEVGSITEVDCLSGLPPLVCSVVPLFPTIVVAKLDPDWQPFMRAAQSSPVESPLASKLESD